MLETETIKVKDMFCRQCEARITEALRGLEGVSAVAVSFDTGNVRVTYDKGICSRDRLLAVIEETGYTAAEENSVNTVVNGISVIVILLAAWYILNAFHLNIVFQKFPVATEGMNYAMLFAIGILTSFHCIAMCGGLNLAATARAEKKAAFYYNLGRLLSYTMIGGLLGLLGSFISIELFSNKNSISAETKLRHSGEISEERFREFLYRSAQWVYALRPSAGHADFGNIRRKLYFRKPFPVLFLSGNHTTHVGDGPCGLSSYGEGKESDGSFRRRPGVRVWHLYAAEQSCFAGRQRVSGVRTHQSG